MTPEERVEVERIKERRAAEKAFKCRCAADNHEECTTLDGQFCECCANDHDAEHWIGLDIDLLARALAEAEGERDRLQAERSEESHFLMCEVHRANKFMYGCVDCVNRAIAMSRTRRERATQGETLEVFEAVMYAMRVGCFREVRLPRPGATFEQWIRWGAMRHLHDKLARASARSQIQL